MRNQKPPFEITNQMIDYVAEISGKSQVLQLHMNVNVQELCGVSAATTNRILSVLLQKTN